MHFARPPLNDYLAFLNANLPWFAALFLAAVSGAQLERVLAASARRGRPRAPNRFAVARRAEPPFDAAQQLRLVERAAFQARPVLNRGERRLFEILERVCAADTPGWRVLAQVSLGEILASADPEAFRAINSKRVDLLLIGANGMPLHAVELQGAGHHLGPAATRDAIKKEALRKAGIGYVEIVGGDTPAEVRRLIARLAGRQAAA